jgi:hypothetical protein
LLLNTHAKSGFIISIRRCGHVIQTTPLSLLTWRGCANCSKFFLVSPRILRVALVPSLSLDPASSIPLSGPTPFPIIPPSVPFLLGALPFPSAFCLSCHLFLVSWIGWVQHCWGAASNLSKLIQPARLATPSWHRHGLEWWTCSSASTELVRPCPARSLYRPSLSPLQASVLNRSSAEGPQSALSRLLIFINCAPPSFFLHLPTSF